MIHQGRVSFRRLRRDIVYCQKSWKCVIWKEERLPLSSQTPQGRIMSEYRFERTFLAQLHAGMTGMYRLDHFGRGHWKGHSDDSWGFNESSSSQSIVSQSPGEHIKYSLSVFGKFRLSSLWSQVWKLLRSYECLIYLPNIVECRPVWPCKVMGFAFKGPTVKGEWRRWVKPCDFLSGRCGFFEDRDNFPFCRGTHIGIYSMVVTLLFTGLLVVKLVTCILYSVVFLQLNLLVEKEPFYLLHGRFSLLIFVVCY